MQHKVKIGVFAIITNHNNLVLLAHRTDMDMRNLPGGGLEQGESPQEGVIREVKEETGLTVSVDKLLGIYTKTKDEEIVFVFKCVIIGGSLTLNNEARDLQYFDLDKIPLNTIPNHIIRINHYYGSNDQLIMQYQ